MLKSKRKSLKTSCAILSLSIACACTSLPPGAPKAPDINLCTLILHDEKVGYPYWACVYTKDETENNQGLDYVQLGISVEDWGRLQKARREYEQWAWDLYNGMCR